MPSLLPLLLVASVGVGVGVSGSRGGAGSGAGPAHRHGAAHDGAAPHHLVTAPTLVAAAVAGPAPIDRSRWSVTAGPRHTGPRPAGSSPAERSSPAGAALAVDGDAATIWRSAATDAGPLPHAFTVDMGTPTTVAGLTYLPRPGATGDRDIGAFRVDLSLDGAAWTAPVATGTFADDATLKTVAFAPTTARYARLTALTEGDGGDRSVSAAEINLLAAVDPALPRTGWTATASSFQNSANQPANALDGSTATIWHSKWTAPIDTLPNWITIDMRAVQTVTGLSYLPRQDSSANGRIGQYRVELSTNGTTWGSPVATGAWADTNAAKTVTFAAASARYVRLTGVTEAGGRGPWTSAAEINLLGPAPGPELGLWSAPITLPLVPAAAAALPDGRVLTWSANRADNYGGTGQTVTAVYDPIAGTVSQRTVTNTGHDMFCPGISALGDGRLLVTGGDDAGRSSIYNPATDSWTTGPAMAIARAYQSTTTLSDGRVFAIGGSWNGGRGGKNGEVWSAANGWQRLSGALVAPMLTADRQGVYRSDNHAWLFGWSGGRVLQAGPSRAMNWYDTTGAGGVTAAGPRATDPDAMNGTAVMYDAGRILSLGGAPHYQDSNATANAHVITIGGAGTVTTRGVSPMRYARAYHNSVVLPDGSVLVTGGQSFPVPFSDNTSVHSAELWNPVTETFTTLAAAAVPRNYHSVAVLLPDARVFTAGGGLCGACATNHFNAEIFTPPYLLNADGSLRARPTITGAPATATHGATVAVSTDRPVSRFSLVRLGTATHTVNTDQRRVALSPTAVAGGYEVTIPADPGVVLPGYYLLFALAADGVPSVARTIQIR